MRGSPRNRAERDRKSRLHKLTLRASFIRTHQEPPRNETRPSCARYLFKKEEDDDSPKLATDITKDKVVGDEERRKMKNKLNKYLLGNVLPITTTTMISDTGIVYFNRPVL